MEKNEITTEKAREYVEKGRVIYVVVDSTDNIVKCFDYHTAFDWAKQNNFRAFNITHPLCPRKAKFQVNYYKQYDMFKDVEANAHSTTEKTSVV